MINEVIAQRLDELIGDYDTPFFNYLLYSYDLSLDECEIIINELKGDIESGKIVTDNVVSTLEDYFKRRLESLEKQDRLNYLAGLLESESDFYVKYLEGYGLEDGEINLIRSRIESKIMEDNICEFEIKRYLEYYFANAVKQVAYTGDLAAIVGNDYDTLIIQSMKRKYPILLDSDIVDIVFAIHGDIIEAKEFRNGIKSEFKNQCMRRSEEKKAKCRKRLYMFVEGSGDSFNKLVEFKGLSKSDGDAIVSEILEDISGGLIQPEKLDSVLITNRFNDYNERQ